MSLALHWSIASALLTLLLFLASLTGNGTGPFGITWLRQPIWSYVLLALAMIIILALTRPKKHEKVEPDAAST